MATDFAYHPAVVSGNPEHSGYWLCFFDDQLLVSPGMLDEPQKMPPWTLEKPGVQISNSLTLGMVDGISCIAARLQSVPSGWQEVGVRDYLTISREDVFKVVNAASQLLYWLSTQNFCSRCGAKLEFDKRDRCLLCLQCEYRSYPKISPCVIVSVFRGREILLAQSHRYRTNMYSCLAGFIECGESAEEAICREIREEVSIGVKNIHYIGSQAWPFPHQLMLGYVAEYADGVIVKEDEELRAADWFDIDHLPDIPPPQTIARKLIDEAITLSRKELSK